MAREVKQGAEPKGAENENFPVASKLLPAWSRGHVMAFYAFARAADDIADAPDLTADEKRNQLQAMSAQLLGGVREPYAQVFTLHQSLLETQVSPRHAQDLLKAFMWDAEHPRTQDWAALMAYCDLSAAPVGRYLIDLLGGIKDNDYGPSDALCAALQVLNHLQDVKDDHLTLQRIYLPDDWLAGEGVTDAGLSGAACSDGLRRVLNRMLDEVDALLVDAEPLPKAIRSRALAREAGGILALAKSLAKALRRRDPLAERVELGKTHMALCFVWGALRVACVGGLSGVSMAAMTDLTAPHPSAMCQHPPSAQAVGSSFYWALRLMPRDRREAMFRVYAFCREVDDIADGVDDPATKRARLQTWRSDVDSLFGDGPPTAAIACLKPVVDVYGLDQADLHAVIDGMQTDAHDAVRMIDEAAFDLYIDRVASAVGRLSDKVFGLTGPAAERLAHHLGRALQITNILRDLDEDAGRNRLYLPLSLLREHGIETDDPQAVLAHAHLAAVLSDLAVRAQAHFDDARTALAQLDNRKTRPAWMMMAVYFRLLQKLQARGLDQVHTRVRLNKFEKLWLVLRHGVL